ncbi:hypothetical protein Tco_1512594, partial [Tanacetum coccineum]
SRYLLATLEVGCLLPECQRCTFPYLQVRDQNRLEVILDQDVGHLQYLQQVFPEKFPSGMVLHQSTLGYSCHSLYLDNTDECIVAVTPPNLGGSGILNIRGCYFIDQ